MAVSSLAAFGINVLVVGWQRAALGLVGLLLVVALTRPQWDQMR